MKCESTNTCNMFSRITCERFVGFLDDLEHAKPLGMLHNNRFCKTQAFTFIPAWQISQATSALLL